MEHHEKECVQFSIEEKQNNIYVQGRSQGVCKGCPGTPLEGKMAGGEYRAEK